MIHKFFKDMPPLKELNKTGNWEINIYTLFPFKTNNPYKKTYVGKLWKAYLKIRLEALIKDHRTSSNYYGIAWGITETKQNLSYGYKKLTTKGKTK